MVFLESHVKKLLRMEELHDMPDRLIPKRDESFH